MLVASPRKTIAPTRRQYTNQSMILDLKSLPRRNRGRQSPRSTPAGAGAAGAAGAALSLTRPSASRPWPRGATAEKGARLNEPLGDDYLQLHGERTDEGAGFSCGLLWRSHRLGDADFTSRTCEPGKNRRRGDAERSRRRLARIATARALFPLPRWRNKDGLLARCAPETIVGWREHSLSPVAVTYGEKAGRQGHGASTAAAATLECAPRSVFGAADAGRQPVFFQTLEGSDEGGRPADFPPPPPCTA